MPRTKTPAPKGGAVRTAAVAPAKNKEDARRQLRDLNFQLVQLHDRRRALEAYLGGNPGANASATVRRQAASARDAQIVARFEELGRAHGARTVIAAEFKVSGKTVRRALSKVFRS